MHSRQVLAPQMAGQQCSNVYGVLSCCQTRTTRCACLRSSALHFLQDGALHPCPQHWFVMQLCSMSTRVQPQACSDCITFA